MTDDETAMSLIVTAKQIESEDIKKAIEEAEKELGIPSHAKVGKSKFEIPPEMVQFLVVLTIQFAEALAKRYGKTIIEWLQTKLGLSQDKGEKVTESE